MPDQDFMFEIFIKYSKNEHHEKYNYEIKVKYLIYQSQY